MDGGAPEPIGTRDAVIEVAYAVGALVQAVQKLTASLDDLSGVVGGNHRDPTSTLDAVEAASADARRTAHLSMASIVTVLEAMGLSRP